MSQLSEVDFQRLQETLLELKTRNYTLEDQSRKQRSALGEAQAKVTVLTEELEKAKKTIDKSKKITEIQKVLSENENLKQKLLAQEDDFRLQNQTLLDELSKLVKANDVLGEECKSNNNQHLNENITELKNKFAEESEQYKREIYKLQSHIEKYPESKFLDLQSQVKKLENERGNFLLDKEKSLLVYEQLLVKYESLTSEFNDKSQTLEDVKISFERNESELKELKLVAENRKKVIDDMALEMAGKMEEKQTEINDLKASLEALAEEKNTLLQLKDDENKSLSLKLQQQESCFKELSLLRNEHQNLLQFKQSLETEIEKLIEAQREMEKLHEKKVDELDKRNFEEKENIKEEHDKVCKEYDLKLELTNVQISEYEEKVSKLKQEIEDNYEDRRISEKKGHALVKDMKRQLQLEKSKNEKLQEKLKEYLETTSNLSGLGNEDRRSVSSWSLMSEQNDRTSTPTHWSSSPFHSSNGIINECVDDSLQPSDVQVENDALVSRMTQENDTLLSRVAKLQEDKWMLEEKVTMLEQSGAQMAEEIVTKSKLILQHCMGSGNKAQAPRTSLSTPTGDNKVRNFVDKLDKLVHLEIDINKESHKQEMTRMQQMLEETLVKNMHLQEDIENMSHEVARLSKLSKP